MSLKHGINTIISETDFSTVTEGTVGIPFFIGCFPIHAVGKDFSGKPEIYYNLNDFKENCGYSDVWSEGGKEKWGLCEAAYSHFQIFSVSPAIFFNVFNPKIHKSTVNATSYQVTDYALKLPFDVINDENLIIKDGETSLVKGTDFDVIYDSENCIIALNETSEHANTTSLSVEYNKVDLSAVDKTVIEAAVEKVEECKSIIGLVPDLICSPGFSKDPEVAAVMAAKASNINGIFKGKAVVDLDCSVTKAETYDKVAEYKSNNGYTDSNMICCWPMVRIGERIFHLSTILCGKISSIDADNGGVPFESPSNKTLPITGCCDKEGKEINLTIQQADIVSVNTGVVTCINFNGWRVWGNYTACYPENKDVAKYFICTNRMNDFICNTFVNSYWNYIDTPISRITIDSIVNSFNIYLSGLTADGKLYGGEIQFVDENNKTSDLIAGKFRLDTKLASPVPAQQINMFVEFDIDILKSAING